MDLQQPVELSCPYCGGAFTTLIDTSAGSYSAVEDCQVCCRPMQVMVECEAGEIEYVGVERA